MKKTKKSAPKSRKRLILGLVIVGAIALAAGFFAYDAILDQQDKQRFETVRSSVEKLRNELQAKANVDEEWIMGVGCRHGSVKLQEALKGCGVAVKTEVEVESEKQVVAIIAKYRKVFMQSTNFSFVKEYPPTPTEFPGGLVDGLKTFSYKEHATNMTCNGSFEIDDEFDKRAKIGLKARILEMSFGCSDRARELHYPLYEQ